MSGSAPVGVAAPALTVVGIGSRWRGDDAVGPLVCDRLRDRLTHDRAHHRADGHAPGSSSAALGSVRVVELGDDLTALVDHWMAPGTLVVVDAVVSGGSPGEVHLVDRVGALSAVGRPTTSSHGLDLAALLATSARTWPRRDPWLVIGVEGASFAPMDRPGAAVRAGVERAVEVIVDLVDDLDPLGPVGGAGGDERP